MENLFLFEIGFILCWFYLDIDVLWVKEIKKNIDYFFIKNEIILKKIDVYCVKYMINILFMVF